MNRTPKTIQEFLDAADEVFEKYPDGDAPYEESIVITHKLLFDICDTLLAVRDGMYALFHKVINDEYEEYKRTHGE